MIEYYKNLSLENLPYINLEGLICWEEFRDIPDYEGLYQVSDLGRVKSLNCNREKIIKVYLENRGYFTARFYKDRKGRTKPIHQLVAMAFLNHTPCGMELVVNHKNFIRIDNRLSNLEIVTNRENTSHRSIKTSSDFVGVSYAKKYKKWTASIQVGESRKHLGTFDCELEASQYYQNALTAINNGTEIKIKEVVHSSKYKGVDWSKREKKWRARVRPNGKEISLGYYLTELEAHEAIEKFKKELSK